MMSEVIGKNAFPIQEQKCGMNILPIPNRHLHLIVLKNLFRNFSFSLFFMLHFVNIVLGFYNRVFML